MSLFEILLVVLFFGLGLTIGWLVRGKHEATKEATRVRQEREYRQVETIAHTVDNVRNRIYNHFDRKREEFGINVVKDMVLDKTTPVVVMSRNGFNNTWVEARFDLRDAKIYIFSTEEGSRGIHWTVELHEPNVQGAIRDMDAYIRNGWRKVA